jgi:hypothetical protein
MRRLSSIVRVIATVRDEGRERRMRHLRARMNGSGGPGGWFAGAALVCALACGAAAALGVAAGGTELRGVAALGASGVAGLATLTFGVVAAMGAIGLVSGAFVLLEAKRPAPVRARARARR